MNPKPVAVVAGQQINVRNFDDLQRLVTGRVNQDAGFTLATLNLDHLVKQRRDKIFLAAYQRMTFVTADGMPIVMLGRQMTPDLQRVAGADIVLPICEVAERNGVGVFMFGSDSASLHGAAQRLQARYPKLIVSGIEAPPQGFDYASAEALESAARIAASGARLCFVCLGAPKQEMFADRMAAIYPHVGFLCVGAALDFVANTQTRAPNMMQRFGLEWIWRLVSHPRRMAWRYALCAVLLIQILLGRLTTQRSAIPERDA
ncbi:MAG: WecB/TagA/CpsF family glycosyltransferase [Rhodopseudomonas sp.]|uniref:WecB/TagA/CpsF family glycosyltransferase n=1 Tax=Rhodopseudomonas sp. TaxID=1078 RepID=UPI001849841C|nr:WecB/TagA/CpsF family glycosyltransferase [Rhodopseudomonas sp.]NVN87195.1 WecB/TagA/CpsF family glycosyltransferase [Rhodopseudomonas sp.]